jgi:hypothetical protein
MEKDAGDRALLPCPRHPNLKPKILWFYPPNETCVECRSKYCWRGPVMETDEQAVETWNELMTSRAPAAAGTTASIAHAGGCLTCGHYKQLAIWSAEYPSVGVCYDCRELAQVNNGPCSPERKCECAKHGMVMGLADRVRSAENE